MIVGIIVGIFVLYVLIKVIEGIGWLIGGPRNIHGNFSREGAARVDVVVTYTLFALLAFLIWLLYTLISFVVKGPY